MTEKKDQTQTPAEPDFDRVAYLRKIRGDLLKKMGLPENTKPEQVSRLLAIKERLKPS